MDVGITTIHNHLNYGAVLQAYALSQAIHRLGHSCKIIDYDIEPGHGRKLSRSRHPGAQAKNLYLAFHWRGNRLFCKRFYDFVQQQIPKTTRNYRTLEELYSAPQKFESYVTGSDQIWYPTLLDGDRGDFYHLGFVSPEESRLVAYAPSFGISEIPERYVERLRAYLLRYHALSVREDRGQEIIKEITGREAEHVLDPTLLLSPNDYAEVTEPPLNSEKYMLVYPMEMGTNKAFYKMVKVARRLLSLRTIIILPLGFHHSWMLLGDKIVLDAGPKQFLGLIKHASFICTNSFHGTVFSILFQKDFLGTPHSATNARIHSLLDKLGLRDRQLTDWNEQAVKALLDRRVDYQGVASRLRGEVDLSLAYLKKALGE